jgi:ribose transport system substrate-binding protein
VAGDEFYITMQCGMEAEAAKVGVSVKSQGPQKFDPTLQKPILDSVVAARPDAIMIATTDVKAMQTPLNAAAQTGSKIVLVDTTVQDPAIAVSAIASDNEGGGKAAFEAIKQPTRTAAR